MNTIYSKNSQKRTVTSLLDGVTEINSKPIIDSSRSGTNYLAKGHLSPDAAFIYNVMQDATYYFINVGPQFQSFNNANWKALEGAARDLAEKLKRDLYVVTGTHGILQYRKEDLTPVSIHLDGPKSNIPVPQYYWKVILDPTTKTGVAFIGLNDPHGNTPKELCTNRCAQMSSWVDWDLQDRDSGFMYCCEVEEAAQAIKSIPGSLEAPGGILGGEDKPSGGDSCQAGPCNCTCVKNNQGDYTCTCTCDKQ